MPVVVDDILTSVSAAQAISCFLGFTEGPVKVLAKGKFDAGRSALEDAYTADSEEDRKELLRDARRKFHEAIKHERGLRKAYTHLGLALCYHHLGELTNTKKHLQKIMTVKTPGTSDSLKAFLKDAIPLRNVGKVAFSEEQKKKLQLAKDKILEVEGYKPAGKRFVSKVLKSLPIFVVLPVALGASIEEAEIIFLEYERISLQELKVEVGRALESGVLDLPQIT